MAYRGVGGVIHVQRGDRRPGVPGSVVTIATEYATNADWSFGDGVRAYSGQYAVGDENNNNVHGKVPGYAVIDLDLNNKATRTLSLFAKVTNAFDRQYFISGLLSDNVFDTPGRLIDTDGPSTSTLFVAPGAPRGYFVGLRYDFAGAKR